jgi:membrane-associated phospholipid phosphatase
LRASKAIRATAWTVVAAGVAAPAVRRRRRLPPPVVLGAAGAAPVALCVARPRTPARDVLTCVLQMWAYLTAYQMPNDDPEGLRRRVRIDYPVACDRVLGLGEPPTLRLQRWLATPGRIGRFDKPLVWAHWMWFGVPHSAMAYILWRHRELFPRAATQMYAVFDLGVIVYWVLPTAPPWYAAEHGRIDGRARERQRLLREYGEEADAPVARRMMAEYGEQFWKGRWQPLYSVLGGNPLAAMPSLHFATSVMAAHLLAEAGPLEGAVGWGYALTLGLALVYLGEHYLVDLLAGLALAEGVRGAAPRAAPAAAAASRAVQRLEWAARA